MERGIEATVLADDSGLEVFALNGEPGIYSARYSGGHGNDTSNNDLLLKKMENVEDRRARYFCALSYQTVSQVDGKFSISEPRIFEGECRGSINHTPVGDMGFGYDPLFVPDGETRTFAQMELEEKKAISHRGNAIRALKAALVK
jgi:XTP/dITP diphosphohydrolase